MDKEKTYYTHVETYKEGKSWIAEFCMSDCKTCMFVKVKLKAKTRNGVLKKVQKFLPKDAVLVDEPCLDDDVMLDILSKYPIDDDDVE